MAKLIPDQIFDENENHKKYVAKTEVLVTQKSGYNIKVTGRSPQWKTERDVYLKGLSIGDKIKFYHVGLKDFFTGRIIRIEDGYYSTTFVAKLDDGRVLNCEDHSVSTPKDIDLLKK